MDAADRAVRVLRAGRDGDVDAVLALLAADPSLARVADPQTGMTLLHQVSRHGHVAVARRLIGLGADVDARNRWGLTPLHYASRYGHREVAELLCAAGAAVDAPAVAGQTALDWAVAFERWSVAELLLSRGAQPSVFAAAGLGLTARLAELLQREPGLVHARNDWGGTPLHLAAIGDRLDAAVHLLARGADAHARDARGRTPLDHARSEAMRRLLRAEGGSAARGG